MAGAVACVVTATAVGTTRSVEAPPGVDVVTVDGRTAWVSSTSFTALRPVLRCPGARKALTYYRAAYARHRATQRLTGPVPFVRYGCEATIRRASEWRDRATMERLAAAAWVREHFHWWEWLPSNWQALGACETGYGRRPGNFAHANSSFVSAFGISRSIYNRDAAYHGGPPWSDDPARRPTPRQQYEAALGHYAMFGDGWTCPGP